MRSDSQARISVACGLTGGDALDHRHVDLRQLPVERGAVDFQEERRQQERGALVAVREGVITRQALEQDRSLLMQRRVNLHVPEPCAGGGERRLGEADVWKAGDLLGRGAEDSSGDFAEVAELRIVDRHGLLAQAAQCLFMFLGKPANPLGPLLVAAGEPAYELRLLRWCRRFRRHRGWLRSRCAHVRIVVAAMPACILRDHRCCHAHSPAAGCQVRPSADPVMAGSAKSMTAEMTSSNRSGSRSSSCCRRRQIAHLLIGRSIVGEQVHERDQPHSTVPGDAADRVSELRPVHGMAS